MSVSVKKHRCRVLYPFASIHNKHGLVQLQTNCKLVRLDRCNSSKEFLFLNKKISFSNNCSAFYQYRGWSGGAKVLCILHHWGVQLILAYSWARPAILVVGKGRGGMFLFLLFLHFHSCSSFFPVPLFHLLYSLFYLFPPFLWETTQNDPQGLTCR